MQSCRFVCFEMMKSVAGLVNRKSNVATLNGGEGFSGKFYKMKGVEGQEARGVGWALACHLSQLNPSSN